RYNLRVLDSLLFFFFQAEDGIRDRNVTGVQTCALPIYAASQFDILGLGLGRQGVDDRHVLDRQVAVLVTEVLADLGNEGLALGEIGRASCRERGEMAVGAVA